MAHETKIGENKNSNNPITSHSSEGCPGSIDVQGGGFRKSLK